MNQMDREPKKGNSGEITIGEFFSKIMRIVQYVLNRWRLLLLFCLLGSVLGLLYSFYKKPKYTAECTFVLEDGSKAGLLGQYSGLASLAGIDLNSGSGLFQGDNIIELYKSRAMIEKALLGQADFDGKRQQLIERYISFNELRDKWRRRDDIENINFRGDPEKFSRKQDSLVTDIVETFNKKVLSVNKLDKKLSIIVVQVVCTDELFAQQFTRQLVETVNTFYVQTKTKKSMQNVQVLQHQADSVRAMLNSSIGGVAAAMDAAPNANPQLLSLKVPSQRRQVDVQASSAVYAEIVKNLEISRITLRQDIPLIQIIDQPVLPLKNDHIGKIKGILMGFILGGIITAFLLAVKKLTFARNR